MDLWSIPLLIFGLGAAFLTLVALLLGRRGVAPVVAHGLGAGGVGASLTWAGVAWWSGIAPAFWAPCLVLVGLYALLFLAPSHSGVACLRRLKAYADAPAVRTIAILVCCSAACAINLALILANEAPSLGIEDIVEHAADIPQLEAVADVAAYTDRGTPISLRTNADPAAGLNEAHLKHQNEILARDGLRDQVIHVPSGWQNCNCHGFVFADGRYWIISADLDLILKENQYRQANSAQPGDVAVYRDADGKVTHSGVVRYVSADSGTILVESKWGAMGRFIHPHNAHCYHADDCSFYRSPRHGHTLHGIPFDGGVTVPEPESTPRYAAPSPPVALAPL